MARIKIQAVAASLFAAGLVGACGPPRGYVSRADLGDKWPLTVEDGVLDCQATTAGRFTSKAVTFTSGGKTYAVNGAAKGRDYVVIEPIWKEAPPLSGFTPLARLSETERRKIFAAGVRCEDDAEAAATAKYPAPAVLADFQRQSEHSDKLAAACKSALRKQHQLTEPEAEAISREGISLSWPPLTRPRMNIQPLIERGLQLCGS